MLGFLVSYGSPYTFPSLGTVIWDNSYAGNPFRAIFMLHRFDAGSRSRL